MTARQSRIDIRTTSDAKKLIEAAANHMGLTASSFILETVVERASAVLSRATQITLTESQSERFLALLDNPPAPNENLKALVKKHYKKNV